MANDYKPWLESGETELVYFRRRFLEESGRAEAAEGLVHKFAGGAGHVFASARGPEARGRSKVWLVKGGPMERLRRALEAFYDRLAAAPPAAPPPGDSRLRQRIEREIAQQDAEAERWATASKAEEHRETARVLRSLLGPPTTYEQMKATPRTAALLAHEERKLAVTERLAEMGFHVPDDEELDRRLDALANCGGSHSLAAEKGGSGHG